ncbi:MAG: hypothetical protein FJY29_03490 [Betaproteobacteria bacterium]|nr:hypothetical protein [Betaproteobacteria bacterium]
MYSALLASQTSLAAYESDGQLKSWCWPRKDAFHNQLRYFIVGLVQGEQAIWLDPERDQISFSWLSPLEHLQIQWHVHHPEARGLRVRLEAKLIDERTLEHTYIIDAHEHSTLRSTRLWLLMAPEVAGRRSQFQCVRATDHAQIIRCDSDPFTLTLQGVKGSEFKQTAAVQIDSQHSLGHLVQSFVNHPGAFRKIEMGRCAALALSPVLRWGHPFSIRLNLAAAVQLSPPSPHHNSAPPEALELASFSQDLSKSFSWVSGLPYTPESAPLQSSLSLRVLDALSSPNGALLASAECDWDMRYSGGYGFVWPRDAAFTGLALLECGQTERAARLAGFLAQALGDANDFEQRYTDAAQPAPSWCYRQPDQRPLVCLLWIALLNSGQLRDALRLELRVKLNTCLGAMADELLTSPTTALSGFDLWEEREGQHFFAFVVAFGALQRGVEHALTDAAAQRYQAAANESARLAQGHFSPLHAWPARTRNLQGQLDFTPDASLLSCLMPVPEFPLSNTQRTQLFNELKSVLKHGVGFRRYADDNYRGGGCWPLVGLWFALGAREILPESEAREEMKMGLRQAAAASTPLGYLPEQVDPQSSVPSWVVPLAWSHAFFLQLSQRLRTPEGR